MKSLLILLGVVFLLSAAVVKCQDQRRRARPEVKAPENTAADAVEDDDDNDNDEEVDVEAEEARREALSKLRNPSPCITKKCKRGEECKMQGQKAVCVCDTRCTEEIDHRYWVCSTKNASFPSECHLDREQCLCRKKNAECKNPSVKKYDLDYYGECVAITPCPKDEFEEFPLRLKDWFFVIMKQLAEREQLSEYLDLLETAKSDQNHTDAILWKFCDLDSSPQDRLVTTRELQYTIRSLKAFEHCLTPFLNFCDNNKDRRITLEEWGACLGIDRDHITNKCKEIRKKAKQG